MWRSQIVAGTFLVVALAFCSAIGWGLYQRSLREEAEATLVEQGVELEGAKRALLVAPKEIVKFVEVPAAVASAVKRGVMTPITAARVEAKSDVVFVPCPPAMPDSRPPDAEQPASTVPVTFGLTGEFFIGKIKHGAVEWTGSLKGTAFNDDWSSDVIFAPENTRIDVLVSKDIAKAVEQYERSWLKKHARFQCPGVGLFYNGKISAGISCTYGISW
jgi:hypothetical protein